MLVDLWPAATALTRIQSTSSKFSVLWRRDCRWSGDLLRQIVDSAGLSTQAPAVCLSVCHTATQIFGYSCLPQTVASMAHQYRLVNRFVCFSEKLRYSLLTYSKATRTLFYDRRLPSTYFRDRLSSLKEIAGSALTWWKRTFINYYLSNNQWVPRLYTYERIIQKLSVFHGVRLPKSPI